MLRASQMASGRSWTGPRDRPPCLHHGEAVLEQRLRTLGRQQVAHPLRGRAVGIVVVRDVHGLAHLPLAPHRGLGDTDGVVEDQHLRGAARRLHQALDLPVVDLLHLVVVVEIRDRAFLRRQGEALPLQAEGVRRRAGVADRDLDLPVLGLPERRIGPGARTGR